MIILQKQLKFSKNREVNSEKLRILIIVRFLNQRYTHTVTTCNTLLKIKKMKYIS